MANKKENKNRRVFEPFHSLARRIIKRDK